MLTSAPGPTSVPESIPQATCTTRVVNVLLHPLCRGRGSAASSCCPPTVGFLRASSHHKHTFSPRPHSLPPLHLSSCAPSPDCLHADVKASFRFALTAVVCVTNSVTWSWISRSSRLAVALPEQGSQPVLAGKVPIVRSTMPAHQNLHMMMMMFITIMCLGVFTGAELSRMQTHAATCVESSPVTCAPSVFPATRLP